MAGTRDDMDGSAAPRFVIGDAPAPGSPFAASVPGVRAVTGPGVLAYGDGLWALPVSPTLPPHRSLGALFALSMPGAVLPAVRMASHGTDWILCRDPAGMPISLRRDACLDEATLVTSVLRPAASTLDRMCRAGLTHRAIRPSNVFLPASRTKGIVELGPFWLAPPALGQNATAETPWVAACLPEARGPGTIADDVYALGVLLLGLAIGGTPLEGVADDEVIDRKIRFGSYAALLGEHRLPPSLADLLASMLADEPSQRPSPERLATGASLAGPKVVSRRRVNAAVPLALGHATIWTTPQLARLIATDAELVRRALLLGQVNHWLRRCLNEIVLAEKLEAAVRPAHGPSPLDSDDPDQVAAALLGISRLLDPEAPLIWRGCCVMADGIGPLLASLDDRPEPERAIIRAALAGGLPVLAVMAPSEEERATAAVAARQVRQAFRSPTALLWAAYELNPTLACRSPLVAAEAPVLLIDLLPALKAGAAPVPVEGSGETLVLDRHLVAFIAARRRPSRPPPSVPLGRVEQLRLLVAVWQETRPGRLPRLASRIASEAFADAASWPGRACRELRREALRKAAATGDLAQLQAVIQDEGALQRDLSLQGEARARIDVLVRRRDALRAGGEARRSSARRFGRDGMAALGTALSGVSLLLQILP